MRTIVIPTDFSATANHAAQYAAEMLRGEHDVNVILYHVYEKASHLAAVTESLENLKVEMLNMAIVRVECIAV